MSERSLLNGLRQERTAEPFRIRGHHLWAFAAIATGEKTPRAAARAQRQYYERNRMSRQHDPRWFASDLEYYRDVIGDTFWDARQQQRAERRVYARFMKLPEEHPLEVTNFVPDAICGTCVIGKHCTEKTSRLTSKPGTTDARGIAKFEQVAERLGLGDELTRVAETVTFSDAPSEVVECVLTTCGVARAVLACPNVDWHKLPYTY